MPGEGVDIHFFNYADYKRHTPFVFLYMGRMLREKGLEYLVEAVKRLHEKGSVVLKFSCWDWLTD